MSSILQVISTCLIMSHIVLNKNVYCDYNNKMANNNESLRHPQQPPLVWGDLNKPWEQVVKDGPVWMGQFPPQPEKSEYEGKYKFQGFELMSPISIAAGPASGKLWTDFYFKMTFGLVMEKTRRTVERESNAAPNIAIVKSEEPITRDTLGQTLIGSLDQNDWYRYMSMTNSFGNPSPNLITWPMELREQRKSVGEGQVLGCSVTATTPETNAAAILNDKSESALIVETVGDLLVAETAAITNGAQLVEHNLACPNVTEHPEEGEMFMNEPLVKYLFASHARLFPNTPAGMKVGVFKSYEQMVRILVAGGDNMRFISTINAIGTQVVGKDGKDILPGRRQTGVAGKVDQQIALEQVDWAAQIREREGLKFEIIGGGGINGPEDADRFLNTGATIVFSGSGVLANPLMAHEYRTRY